MTPAAVLTAQDLLTPATLEAWNSTGAAPLVAQDQRTITVPAGGQLARVYPAGELIVHLISQPFFGATVDNCPALEAGPASLTFVRTRNGGGMVLLGDQPLPLPSAITLGADYRSLQPLDLSLNFDLSRNQATVVLAGASYTVAATTSATQMQVAVSAGNAVGWTLATLEVSSNPGSAGSAPSSGAAGGSGSTATPTLGSVTGAPAPTGSLGPIDLAARQHAFASAVSFAAAGDLANAEKTLATISHYPANTSGWELEMASNLVQVAFRVREDGNLDSSAKIARLVLQHSDRCVQLASTDESGFAGSALELAGLVNSRFFGDLNSAEAYYRKALIISPGLTSAQSALDRLLDARESELKKLQAWGLK